MSKMIVNNKEKDIFDFKNTDIYHKMNFNKQNKSKIFFNI